MLRHEHRLIVNGGELTDDPRVYSYGSVKGIEVHLSEGGAVIVFRMSRRKPWEAFAGSDDRLVADALRKTMVLHLVRYGKALDIESLSVMIGGETREMYRASEGMPPLVYAMAEGKLLSPLGAAWHTKELEETLLSVPQSRYDGRMNALIALLIAKQKPYRSERSMYLWMAMNGFYNYLSDECKKAVEGCIAFGRESKQHRLLIRVMGREEIALSDDGKKERLRRELMAVLKRCQTPPEELYESALAGTDSELTEALAKLREELELPGLTDAFTVMTVWLPYQIRCQYFHSRQAMPIFLYGDEPLLKALGCINYFVDRYVSEELAKWLTTWEITEENRQRIEEAYAKMPEGKKK